MKFTRTDATFSGARRKNVRMTDRIRSHTQDAITEMVAEAESTRRGSRKRAVPVVVAGLAALGAMVTMVTQSALAVNFTASNSLHYMYSDKVVGTDSGIYIDKQTTQAGGSPTAQIGFKNAKLSGFCLLAPQSVAGFGTIVMKLTAGEPVDNNATTSGTSAISIDNLFVGADSVLGDGSNITNMYVGRNAADIAADTGITGFSGTAGGFGITADTMDVSKFSSGARAVNIAGPLTLPGLKISVSLDSDTPTVAKCV